MNANRGTLSKKASKVLISLLVIFISIAIVSAGLTAVCFSVAFSRSDEITPLEYSYRSLGESAPLREAVSFYSGDNRLSGYLYPTDGAKAVVLIAAGMSSGADSHLAEILYFTQNGFSVFAFDGTGVRESEGRGMIGLSQTKLDTFAALEALEADERTGSLPVLLYGHSVGGYAAAAAISKTKKVAAAVSIAAFDSPLETMLYYGRKKVGLLADLGYPFVAMENRFLFGAGADSSAADSINSTDTPILIVEGSEDTVIPDEIAISRSQITNPNARVLIVSERWRSGHSGAWLSSDAARYRSEYQKGEAADLMRANELDPDFMRLVCDFYEGALLRADASAK